MRILETELEQTSAAGIEAGADWAGNLRGALGSFPALGGRQMWSYAVQGGSSVLQQGLFAGASFFTNVLLARWLPAASYGAFALAYAVFLLLQMCYGAVFFEPIIVYGAGRYAGEFSSYIRAVVRTHFLMLVPLSVLLVLLTPLIARLYTPEFQVALMILCISSPFLLLVWLCRGAFYAQFNAHAGTAAGACYFALLLMSLAALRSLRMLSASTALASMAAVSFLVSAACLSRFRKRSSDPATVPELESASVAADHWHYGRWASLTAFAIWIPTNMFYLILPSRFGLASTATLRAAMNLMYPLLNSFSALVLLLMPFLVRQLKRDGLQRMKQTTLQLLALFVPVAIAYFLVLTIFGSRLLHFLYAGRYSNISGWAIMAIGFLPVTTGVVSLLGATLRALERPYLVFWACLASTIVAVTVGIPLTLRLGVLGASIALVLNDLPAIAVLAILLARSKEPGI